jgi:DNA-binding GntR family transcriptional regulator
MRLKRGNTTEEIYQKIKQDIMTGTLQPSDRLATEKLAAQYKVSRTPVREALKKLEKDGLIETKSNAGAMIKQVDIEEISDIYEIRKALEVIAIKKVIKKGIAKKLLKELEECCAKRKSSDKLEDLEDCDRNFHMNICRASGSKLILNVMENYMVLLSSFNAGMRIMQKRDLSRDSLSNEEHENILEAIKNEDSQKAVLMLEKHIDSALNVLQELNKERAQ